MTIGFVRLDNHILAAKRTGIFDLQHGHRFSDTVPEEPCGFKAAAKRAVKLASRNALLTAAHHVDRLQPDMEWDVARLENGPHAHCEGLAASATFPEAGPRRLAFQLRRFIDRAAMRTNRTIGPKPRFDEREGGIFVSELGCVQGGLHGGLSPRPPFYLWGAVCQV
jgi:hypothetical protein